MNNQAFKTPRHHHQFANTVAGQIFKPLFFLSLCLICLLPLRANALTANGISLIGNVSYKITGDTIDIKVDKIANTRAENTTSGKLRLTLWAFLSPYNTGQERGYEVATYELGTLKGGTSYPTFSSGSIPYVSPPKDGKYFTLFIDEYDDKEGGYLWDDYRNFPSASTTNSFYYIGQVIDTNKKPVANAQVSFISNHQYYAATTDSSGNFKLSFDKSNIPSTLTYWVTKTGYVPFSGNLKVTGSAVNVGEITLEQLNDRTVVVEIEPDVHHLGDGKFTGSINSQFQTPVSEGSSYQRSFNVSSTQMNSTGATLTFLAKGVNCADKLALNNVQIATLGTSPSDGSYGTQTITVPIDKLVSGNNTLSLISVSTGGSSCGGSNTDIDDFEFTNIILKFAGTPTVTPVVEVPGVTTPIADSRVFAFAEANYPGSFAGKVTEGQAQQYHYRYYAGTGNYLAVDTAGDIYGLGPYTNGAISSFGPVTNFVIAIVSWEQKSPTTPPVTSEKLNQTIAFGAVPSITLGGSGNISATATSGLAVSFHSTTPTICTVNGSTVTGVKAGTCIIAANQAGDSKYNAAPEVTQSFAITQEKLTQTITISIDPDILIGGISVGGSRSISATTTSGLAVSFSSTTPSICTVSGNTITGVKAGTCIISATQTGNGSYAAASAATQSIRINGISVSTSPYAGQYTGTYSGDDAGTISATIAADGSISGIGKSTVEVGYQFTISGNVISAGGVVDLTGTGAAGTSSFSGIVSAANGTISGTWRDDASTDSGTFLVRK